MTILTSQNDPVRAASGTWQQQMKWAIRDVESLRTALRLPTDTPISPLAAQDFPVFVPLPYLSRIAIGQPNDPLLRQVLPAQDEEIVRPGFSDDPLAEGQAQLTPGLLQKYVGRVLMVTTGACAIHCRYCFRRNFPYGAGPTSVQQWQPAIEKIAADPSIHEVIFSGGDPLTLTDDKIADLIGLIQPLGHVSRIRLHTRLPIMIPQRITDRLVQLLQRFDGQVIVVIHANHANEFDHHVDAAIAQLKSASNLTMLNQSVLLSGVNDDADSLIALSHRLLQAGVLPYYLHQLDRIHGAGHFEVDRDRGIELINTMRANLPGYAVPRFVKEEPGRPGKTVWA